MIIIDLPIPKSCDECFANYDYICCDILNEMRLPCNFTIDGKDLTDKTTKKLLNCPLKEL